ncbi:MAG: hypothetical protein L6416_06655 [Candidatus Omnitrophica bacterium]|nr:hypothetical protein [Candidatus Omnitrophota bacterium]
MRMIRGESGQRFKSFSLKKVALFKVIYLTIIAYLIYFLILILAKGI